MTTFYQIHRYQNSHPAQAQAKFRSQFSIDQVASDGTYTCQIAFWFQTRSEAQRRLQEIIAEDAAEGQASEELLDIDGVRGWRLTPGNGGNAVNLYVRDGYRLDRDGSGRLFGPDGKRCRLSSGDTLSPIFA